MEALRSIDEIQLVRLLRRDERERLFVGTPPAGAAATELVHLFALPRGRDTAAHIERYLQELPEIPGMGRKDPASLYLVMEDPEGLPLDRILAESPDWAGRCGRAWLASLCGEVDRLHARGLACCRILPRHLMVKRGGGAIIAEPLTITLHHRIHGAVPFQDPAFLQLHPEPGATPPELVFDGAPAPACDVFQVGVLLHRFLTGRPPYGAGSTLELFNRVRSGRIEHPVPEHVGDLAALAAACLAPSPGDRPAAGELAAALEEAGTEAGPPDIPLPCRYSDTFPPLMQLHDGEGAGDAEPAEPALAAPTEEDREQAIAQLDALLSQADAGRRREMPRSTLWLITAMVVAGAGFLLWMFFTGTEPAPSSRVGPGRGGRTHSASNHDRVTTTSDRSSRHLDNIPAALRARVEDLGFPTRNVPLAARRAGRDCEVVTEGADGLRHRFVFPRCRDLSRVCTLDKAGDCAPRPDGTCAFRVLYDPSGAPRLLQGLDHEGAVLKNIEIPGGYTKSR